MLVSTCWSHEVARLVYPESSAFKARASILHKFGDTRDVTQDGTRMLEFGDCGTFVE